MIIGNAMEETSVIHLFAGLFVEMDIFSLFKESNATIIHFHLKMIMMDVQIHAKLSMGGNAYLLEDLGHQLAQEYVEIQCKYSGKFVMMGIKMMDKDA